ncbi:expressed unknown protein [Seminavis robusta]|uniref:Uncharacterized protein n=1 Tax=Seminavis robusta TaxID=568900 RepID=A0A9N8EL51_9STRA|nr:expressed unknown protein [Seminavis robusta]|eukprot:Sro1160_g247730.1 n/a (270) ;mRNA; r:16224-17033
MMEEELEARRLANEKKLALYDELLMNAEELDPKLALSLKQEKLQAIDEQMELLQQLYEQRAQQEDTPTEWSSETDSQSAANAKSDWSEQIKSIGDQMNLLEDMYNNRRQGGGVPSQDQAPMHQEDDWTVQTEDDSIAQSSEAAQATSLLAGSKSSHRASLTSRLFGRRHKQRSPSPARFWKKAFVAEIDEEIDSMRDYLRQLEIGGETASPHQEQHHSNSSCKPKRASSPSWRAFSSSTTTKGRSSRKQSPARKKPRGRSPDRGLVTTR